jgi:hypothetical protein
VIDLVMNPSQSVYNVYIVSQNTGCAKEVINDKALDEVISSLLPDQQQEIAAASALLLAGGGDAAVMAEFSIASPSLSPGWTAWPYRQNSLPRTQTGGFASVLRRTRGDNGHCGNPEAATVKCTL